MDDVATDEKAVASVSKFSTIITNVKSGSQLLGSALFSTIKSWAPGTAIKELFSMVMEEIVNSDGSSESGVSFSGGVGLFSIAATVYSTQAATSATTSTATIGTTNDEDTNNDVAGADIIVNTVAGATSDSVVGINDGEGTITGNSLVIDLGDPDEGDLFDVIIRKDTVFGSPVYVTMSGQSRCPAEAGTLQREGPNMQWQGSNSSLHMLPHSPSIWIV